MLRGVREDSGVDVGLRTIAWEWGRIGCLGFGGPPAHVALLRGLVVAKRGWMSEGEFEDGVAVTNLLPGPASTQLAILCAWRLRGAAGAIVGGLCFIVPGLVLILALAALVLAEHAPAWVLGAAAGAGAAVPAVAAHAAWGLIPGSWKRAGVERAARARWIAYLAAGIVAAAVTGPWVVVVLVVAGAVEMSVRVPSANQMAWPVLAGLPASGGLVWVAAKVGALSYGGGFVIIPLMREDAVDVHGWMTDAEFLNAVALGQITPGPVVQTIAVVGYAAAGLAGGLLAATIAFAPSFVFVLLGGPRLDRLRDNKRAQAFLTGAGAAAIGAIAGTVIPLMLTLTHWWQFVMLAIATVCLRWGVVATLVGAGVAGALISLL
ncbi:chromate transporter [Actinokineospora globicatena]|uniref:chromate transporter n=1 Tax=Actinokineospora globicatena TaxID=103729 RepID=UPI0024A0819B|nr:chromate transporter [Actinokineospora globicatena]GLW77884.1 chromate resistance transporter [Actinokineospora globicatena]GLW85449.1 chromate resistance transporter [Actinokineospora globicatena]